MRFLIPCNTNTHPFIILSLINISIFYFSLSFKIDFTLFVTPKIECIIFSYLLFIYLSNHSCFTLVSLLYMSLLLFKIFIIFCSIDLIPKHHTLFQICCLIQYPNFYSHSISVYRYSILYSCFTYYWKYIFQLF